MAKSVRAAGKGNRRGVTAASRAAGAAGRAVEPPVDPSVDRALGAPIWPRFENSAHVVLWPGGRRVLSPEDLERACLPRLTKVLEQALLWDGRHPSFGWMVGDHTIVCVETMVTPDASLYVQFWSEPQEPVLWEVSSGHANPGARPFIKGEPSRRLRAMGFRIGGEARNFGRRVTVGTRDEAAQVARDVLRIYHEALGYRGRTPLTVEVHRCRRAAAARVISGVTPEDVRKLLVRAGFGATPAEPEDGRPRLTGTQGEFSFDVTLDARDEETGLYTAVDVAAPVAPFEGTDMLVEMNLLNQMSRVGCAWIAGGSRVVVMGTSLAFVGGLTEAHIVERLTAWVRLAMVTITDLAPTRTRAKDGTRAKGGRRAKGGKSAAGSRGAKDAAAGTTLVH